MKNIFVSKNIAQKLKKIGFDEPCIAYYGAEINETYPFNVQYKPILISINQPSEKAIPAPTWEQVFKWFRDRGYHYKIIPNLSGKYNVAIRDLNMIWVYMKNINTYEQARENLILELIKIYKNQKLC